MHSSSPLSSNTALQLVLQHPCVTTDQQLVCTLLSVSWEMSAAIEECCRGLQSTYKAPAPTSCFFWPPRAADKAAIRAKALQHMRDLNTWLDKHKAIINGMDLTLVVSDAQLCGQLQQLLVKHGPLVKAVALINYDHSTAATAAALQRAAPRLQLCSFTVNIATPDILQQLPASTLTRLETGNISLPGAQSHTTCHALAALSSLRELHLATSLPPGMADALSKLTRLTTLSLGYLDSDNLCQLKHLPPQLLELHVAADSWCSFPTRRSLHLGHLTALTKLDCYLVDPQFATDVWPPNVVNLSMKKASCGVPLLVLQQLQQLSIKDCYIPAAELHQMAAKLTNLKQLDLHFESGQDVEAAAAAFSALPPFSLHLDGTDSDGVFTVSPGVVQQLGSAQGLTRLELEGVHVEASRAEFDAALQQLKGLNEVCMYDVEFTGHGSSASGDGSSASDGMASDESGGG